MERVNKIMNLTTLIAFIFLALVPKMESQNMNSSAVSPITQRPLCASQFALANYACVKLPFSPGSPPEPPPDSPPSPDDDGGDDNDDGGGDNDDGGDDNDDDDDHHHHHDRRRHGHGHGHRHGHRHRNRKGPEEEECCRWAKEVDSQCVCELLVRLPPFLMRPVHQYSLDIGDDCHITYSCGGPI
ncbi:PREDICTED: pheromone-processing carboxypeptidase KEX1-like [Lupinus angustifolius]|uniref:pheromone-processing carboxypeptidase KEX1-like n=1 Tax=Lupinus angustifolius TaxID=3871 RepID=UPI00092E5146|nr:PREDICTED: pheromone-processing carboxypeptidase KEX1-like [Lupinus angustifolius]